MIAETTSQDPDDAIAIIGMVGRFPGARNLAEFWRNLAGGIDSISHFAEGDLEPSRLEPQGIRSLSGYVRARGVLDDADKFDAAFFGVTPRDAAVMDPQHRVFLQAAWAALEDAGYDPAGSVQSIGIWAGMANPTYYLENVLTRRDVVESIGPFQAMLLNEKDYLTTRVSYKLNLRGPSVSVHTACSTSLVAVCQACQALLSYQCDMALAGGVAVTVPQRRGYLHVEGAIGSPDGHCRAFDAEAAGTVLSDGVGIVVLKRLTDALEGGDTIRAVIRGWAVNNDGSGKVSFTAPSVDGQAEVIATAQALAGVGPETISYVEAHGTATPLGDPIEVTALTKAFRTGTDARGYCAIGSVKSNIGHVDAAAGVAGLIKAVLALGHRQLPPTVHFTRPNPEINFENSPFFVNSELRPWARGSTPRRAGVSSFGIGGTNAHVVLEEAPVAVPTEASRPEQLLVLSAKTKDALEAAAANLARHLRADPELALADVAHTLRVGRRPFDLRRALVAHDALEAATILEGRAPARPLTGTSLRSEPAVVFLFPGQGAQQVGMAAGLYRRESVFRAELDGCAEALLPHVGTDIRCLIFAEPAQRATAEERLAETSLTQPALFAVEYALARQWMEWGVSPAGMIGHSLGEYVAACLAGVMSRDAAARLVAARGRLMQAQPRGAMLAVWRSAAEIAARLGPDVAIAGLNAPELTVVSGPQDAIRALESKLNQEGVGCKMLATSHAFHSPLMDGALAPFREVLAQVRLAPPSRRWISCLTGDWISPAQAVDPEYWVQQLRQPVRFSDGVRQLAQTPDLVLLEVGPGHTLSGLVRQHRERPAEQAVITSLGIEPEKDVSSLLEALGQLWIAGVKPDWAAVHGDQRPRRVPLPTYPFEPRRFWLDPPALDAKGDMVAEARGIPGGVPSSREDSGHSQPAEATPARDASAEVSVEGRVLSLLSSASGLTRAEINPAASFMELGFDSLLLVQTSGAIEKAFGVNVAFRELIQTYPTPAALTAHIEARLAEQSRTLPPPTSAASQEGASRPVATAPPVPGARLGRDATGKEAWFVPDPDRPGKYLQLTIK